MSRARWTACAVATLLLAAGCDRSARTADETASPPAAGPEAATAEITAKSAQQTADEPCDAHPRNHTIVVGAEKVSCKEPHVSKSGGNQITWRSASGESIEVVFKAKGGVNPFPGLT